MMKINSKDLWKYVNELPVNEKVKFNVYYDDSRLTQIYWDGDGFEWETGTFNSEGFFSPLYDFEPIVEKKIPEKLNKDKYIGTDLSVEDDMFNKINEIIDYLKGKRE